MGKSATFDIRIWGVDGVLASALSTPIDILVAANLLNTRRRHGGQPLFRWSIESPDGRPIRTASGQTVAVDGPISARRTASAVYIASPFSEDAVRFVKSRSSNIATLIRTLQRAYANGSIVATHCAGTFVLAEAGLLRHRKATTHWARAKDLVALYPDIRLDIREVLTEDGNVICGGAVTAYSNVMLAIVRRLAGEELASDTARYLLIDRNRGAQTAYAKENLAIELPPDDALVTQAKNWISANYWRPFRVADIADTLGVSERTFNRRFKEATAVTPIRFIQAIRVESAKRLLEEGGGSAQEISQRVGYEDLATFRELFKRETGMTLAAYQTKFMKTGDAAGARRFRRHRAEPR
jgi:transcriptional regulator GlxA family with amidase domain